jgi:hypothetical protein
MTGTRTLVKSLLYMNGGACKYVVRFHIGVHRAATVDGYRPRSPVWAAPLKGLQDLRSRRITNRLRRCADGRPCDATLLFGDLLVIVSSSRCGAGEIGGWDGAAWLSPPLATRVRGRCLAC